MAKGPWRILQGPLFCRFAKAYKLAKRLVKTHVAVRYKPRMAQWLGSLEEFSN